MTRPRAAFVLVLLAPILAMASCGSGESSSGPPEINFGRDVCAECHMIISEARFAAAYRDRSGEPFVFDDIGDMVGHATRTGVLDDMTAWVHDYDTEEWVEAPDAWYVRSTSVETPMVGGIIAFGTQGPAERFAAEDGGEVLRWSDVLAGASEPTDPTTITDPTSGTGADHGADTTDPDTSEG